MRGSIITTKDRFSNLHPRGGTHWALCINGTYVDTYGCPPTKLFTTCFSKRNGKCVFSDEKIQEKEEYCATYCL